MLRKEIKEVLGQSLFFVGLSLLLPLLLKLILWSEKISFLELYLIPLQIGLLYLAMFLGNSLFLSDRRQKAVDYLLSLPYSKLRLLGIKTLPRIGALLCFYILFILAYRLVGGAHFFMSAAAFSCAYFALFVMALFFSASLENFSLSAVATLLGMGLFMLFLYLIPRLVSLYHIGAGISPNLRLLLRLDTPYFFGIDKGAFLAKVVLMYLVLLLPFVIAFVMTFKKLGLCPVNRFNKVLFKKLGILFAVGVLISVVVFLGAFPKSIKEYHLTNNHQLLELTPATTIIYNTDSAQKVDGLHFNLWTSPIEVGNYLYFGYNNGKSLMISRVHAVTGQKEVLFKKLGKFETRPFVRLRVFDDTVAFLTGQFAAPEKSLYLIDIKSKGINRIDLKGKLPAKYYTPLLLGVAEYGGQKVWLISSEWNHRDPIMLIGEDGSAENLGKTDIWPRFEKNMLFTGENNHLVIREVNENGVRELKRVAFSSAFNFLRIWRERDPLLPSMNKLYGKISGESGTGSGKNRQLFGFDMDTLEVEMLETINGKVQALKIERYVLIHSTSGHFYLLELKRSPTHYGPLRCFQVQGDDLKLVKSFPFSGKVQPNDSYWLSSAGIVIRRDNRVKVYVFPDLKELTFTKLNK